MAVSKGKKEKYSVKVFYVNTEDLEKELNDWLDTLDKYHELIDVKLSSCQNKSVAMAIIREII